MTKTIENNLFQNNFQVINEAEEHKFADDDEENKYEMPANQQCGSPYDSEFKSESADCKFTQPITLLYSNKAKLELQRTDQKHKKQKPKTKSIRRRKFRQC